MRIRIGTRGSRLALEQTELVKKRLEEYYPEHEYEIVVIKTKGDIVQDRPLSQLGSKGVFVKEIEEQLCQGDIDLAVHSMKDMPSNCAEGLSVSRFWKREDCRDVLVLREAGCIDELKQGAVIGTGSLRRAMELKKLRPDVRIVDIRGNVDTRLRKMEEESLDGLVLAAAGLKRLGLEHLITCYLEPDEMIPAPAQGILALQYASENIEIENMLNQLADEETDMTGSAERAYLREMGGDCKVPIGAHGYLQNDKIFLKVLYGRPTEDGQAEIYYGEASGSSPEAVAKQAAMKIRKQMAGQVYLVSAGPGDAGLITVRGMQLLKSADCVIYDRLIAPELLTWTKKNCEKIYVGKENHHHAMSQEKIQDLLVKKALEHKHVVRLKGGDAYVFGRGGEEMLWLRQHQIPCEIVPGVTSAIAVPAMAGIPVTHRGMTRGFRVLTAHNAKDEFADIDFRAIVNAKETCVFLMGLANIKEIADGFRCAGAPKDMPIAVISQGTTARQKVVITDLEHVETEVERAKMESPALIVVGDVVRLSEKIQEKQNAPLLGKRYLIPKVGTEESLLARMIRENGGLAEEITVGEIHSLEVRLSREDCEKVDWLLFTSANGVGCFFENLEKNHLDIRAYGKCKIGAIGVKTAEALKMYGILADVIPQIYSAENFAECMKAQIGEQGNLNVCYVKPRGVHNEIKAILGEKCNYSELEIYENKPVAFEFSKQDTDMKFDGICFTCSSTARRFLDCAKQLEFGEIHMFSIGKKTTETLEKSGFFSVSEASEATYESMVKIIVEKCKNH